MTQVGLNMTYHVGARLRIVIVLSLVLLIRTQSLVYNSPYNLEGSTMFWNTIAFQNRKILTYPNIIDHGNIRLSGTQGSPACILQTPVSSRDNDGQSRRWSYSC